ncbi:MAG: hypothetical protein K8U03_21800 [Planctomycetia bacterium]|nr:hypothetical protein [Planctomycetia bacterium]
MNLPLAFARRMLASLTCAALIAASPAARAADEKPAAKPEAGATEKSIEKGTEKTAEKPAKEGTEKKVKKVEERRGPLPAHFAKIVDPDQKEKIYIIQDRYQTEIAPLAAKIKEIQAQRDQEIEGVLTADQVSKLKFLRLEAAANAKRPMKTATVEGKPATEAKPTTTEKPVASEKPAAP